jgi:hypothetical protein
VVVVFEIRYSASVEQDQARMIVEARRMGLLADAGRLQAESALIMDIESKQSGDDANASGTPMDGSGGQGGSGGQQGGSSGQAGSSGHSGSSGAAGGLLGAGSGSGASGSTGGTGAEGGGDSVAETTASTDSLLDEWNDPVALAPSFGEDFQVLVEVEDEDSKVNLLGLWTADETQREAQRQIMVTLLDKAFEGTTLDLSFPDAISILDRLDDWARGNRGAFDPIPAPALKKSNAEDKAEEGGVDQTATEVQEKNRPLTLDELGLIEGIKPEHLHGFVENDEFHPGLERYLTIWSQLEMKPPPPVADPFGNSPFTKFTQGSLFDKTMGQSPDQPTAPPAELPPTPTNDGLVNVNTAPLVVLRALAPDDVPTSFLEKVVEFRKKINELKQQGAAGMSDSLFSQDKLKTPGATDDGSGSSGSSGASGSSSDNNKDDDPSKYVFTTVNDVIDKVEQEFELTLALDPAVQTTFLSRLAVTSNVFTIKVLVYTLAEDNKSGEKVFGRHASYRAVVWRMVTTDGARMLTLLPLEPYFDARRFKDYGHDLSDFKDEHADRLREQEQQVGQGF